MALLFLAKHAFKSLVNSFLPVHHKRGGGSTSNPRISETLSLPSAAAAAAVRRRRAAGEGLLELQAQEKATKAPDKRRWTGRVSETACEAAQRSGPTPLPAPVSTARPSDCIQSKNQGLQEELGQESPGSSRVLGLALYRLVRERRGIKGDHGGASWRIAAFCRIR